MDLTTGTWAVTIQSAGGTVTNYALNAQVQLGINTVGGVQITQQYVALNASTAGRYATAAWTCPNGTTQVKAFAKLLAAAIVGSGQKFKVSQPMFALSTYDPQTYLYPSAIWSITSHRVGKATITYTDSTP